MRRQFPVITTTISNIRCYFCIQGARGNSSITMWEKLCRFCHFYFKKLWSQGQKLLVIMIASSQSGCRCTARQPFYTQKWDLSSHQPMNPQYQLEEILSNVGRTQGLSCCRQQTAVCLTTSLPSFPFCSHVYLSATANEYGIQSLLLILRHRICVF